MHHPLGRAPAKCLNSTKKKKKKRGVTGAVERQWKAEKRYGWIEEGVREERERERKNERGIGREGERGRREYGEREC